MIITAFSEEAVCDNVVYIKFIEYRVRILKRQSMIDNETIIVDRMISDVSYLA